MSRIFDNVVCNFACVVSQKIKTLTWNIKIVEDLPVRNQFIRNHKHTIAHTTQHIV